MEQPSPLQSRAGGRPSLAPTRANAQVTRRAFLRFSAAAAALFTTTPSRIAFAAPTAAASEQAAAKPTATGPAAASRSLAFDNLHTGEKLSVVYAHGDEYNAESLAKMNYLLRDHRSGEVHPIEPALFDWLHDLQMTVGDTGSLQVISGYRSPATNAKLRAAGRGVATKSLHMQGKAIDVRLPNSDMWSFRQAAIDMQVGGVGYYKSSNFVHLDTGRVRTW